MKEIIQEVVGVFSKAFPLAYKDALIAQLKKEAQPSEDPAYLLSQAPAASFELKAGMMTKCGDSHKSWKARHFIAFNESDNYKVEYYEKEGGALKGTVTLSGYRPQHYDKEEAKENQTEFGLKLVPHDSRRRTWMFKCASEEDRNEWMTVFQTGCYKAKPPLNKDPLIAKAFSVAYRATRWNYGYYGWYSVDCTETETLSQFVTDVLERELLSDVYNNIPASPAKTSTVNMLKKSVDTTVGASVGAAFTAGLGACDSMKSALESAVRASLGPIFEKEVGIKVQITEKISGKINPFCSEIGSKICGPVTRAAAGPFTKAFSQTIKGVHKQLKECIDKDKLKADVLDGTLRHCSREVNHWWSGPLEETNKICTELHTGKLSMIESLFEGGFSLYELHQIVLEKNRYLAQGAIYTFGERVKTAEGGVSNDAILNEVTAMMLHDAKMNLHEVLCDIMKMLMAQSVATSVTTPCTELVAPIQAVIDQLPGLGEFFNLPNMLEFIIDNIIVGAIAAIVDAGFDECGREVDAAGKEVGVTAAK